MTKEKDMKEEKKNVITVSSSDIARAMRNKADASRMARIKSDLDDMLSEGIFESEEVDVTTNKIFNKFIKPSLDYQAQLTSERDGLKENLANWMKNEANHTFRMNELQTLKDAVHWVLGQHGVPEWIINKLKTLSR